VTPAAVLLALVTAERLGELWWAARNTAWLRTRGGYEVAAGHYPAIVALHGTWLSGLWWLGRTHAVDPGWLAVYLALQGARAWVLLTLGRRWTTRIIVVPGAPLVAAGPYRWLAHPNYAVVIGEIAALPLCLGLPWYAAAFSLANLALLAVRVRAESAALTASRGPTAR
jgi:methyltransferase